MTRTTRTMSTLALALSAACGAPSEEELADGLTTGRLAQPVARIDTSCNEVFDVLIEAEAIAVEMLRNIELAAPQLRAGGGRQPLEQRFGPVSDADVDFILDMYAQVEAVLGGTTYQCRDSTHPDCSGDFSGAFARTAKAESIVRLCPPYFSPSTPQATQASVMIHELTHQNRVSPSGEGTDDDGFPSIVTASSFELYALRCAEGCL